MELRGYVLQTHHTVLTGDARTIPPVADASVHLVVTSPPYPMVAMWDEAFGAFNPDAASALQAGNGMAAFEAMHLVLDAVWSECRRVLVPGGFLCVNIGDATRSVTDADGDSEFCLYPNHARILASAMRLGFTPLPDILWRKPNNSPNKFMGSGMLPAGAYVTYEHEYILVLRKGGKRAFDAGEKVRRTESAYFWEERNVWFSDLWTDLRGARQELGEQDVRERSAAFPFELPYRLIHMFAMQGDVVLDPFAGTGTTMAAALAAGRSSIGVEREAGLASTIDRTLRRAVDLGRERVVDRLANHEGFMRAREAAGKQAGHVSAHYGFPVITRQEVAMRLPVARSVQDGHVGVLAEYDFSRPGPGALFGRS